MNLFSDTSKIDAAIVIKHAKRIINHDGKCDRLHLSCRRCPWDNGDDCEVMRALQEATKYYTESVRRELHSILESE